MNGKFRKLMSGFVTSVGVMSSLVCPCVQAKWGEGTHAMTDEEFKAFYKKVGIDAFNYSKSHADLSQREANGDVDSFLGNFDSQNNLGNASFLDTMKNYCGLYESSLKDENKFSNCRVLSFMAIDYFQKNNIKSAYMQIGDHTFSGDIHDVVIYEGKNNDWFVADLSMFFSIYYCRLIKKIRDDFELRYGFDPENIKYILQFPLRDYINKYAKNFNNRIFAVENSGNGNYLGCKVSNGDNMLLPYWIKNSGACDKSFMDKFLIDRSISYLELVMNSKDLKFIAPQKIVEKSGNGGYVVGGFAVYKGTNGEEVAFPVA